MNNKKRKEIDEIDEALASWKELIAWAKEDKKNNEVFK